MNIKVGSLSVFLLFILVFTGCTSKELNILELPSQSQERPTITPSLFITSSATSTLASTLPLTPSIKPTTKKLTSEEFHNLLLPDMTCRFPCWWGMEPGITTIDEINKRNASLGLTLSRPQNQKDGLVLYQDGVDLYTPNLLSNTVNIYTSKGIVSKIHISASSNDYESFWEIWSPYLPQLLLRQYNPDRILLLIYSQRSSQETNDVIYRLIFQFDENQAMVEYSGITIEKEGIYQICPNHSESGNLSPYLNLYTGDFNNNVEDFLALENASEYNLETIIEGIQSSESFCVASNKSYWD